MDSSQKEGIEKLVELVRDIEVAMLTSVDTDGSLHSRPMMTQRSGFDGDLWFFTSDHSPKIHEMERNPQVCVTYSEPKRQRYVAVTGRAEKVRDPSKIKELWNPAYRAWFPNGPEDPSVVLLRIHPERAEYWDSPSSGAVHLIGLVKAVATGERLKTEEAGEHKQMDLTG